MRKRVAITLVAGGRWPDAGGDFGVRFNWIKIDNKGSGSVDVSLAPTPASGDKIATLFTVSSAKVRVLNVAGPANPDGTCPEDWPQEVHLISASGTTLYLEVADHPIVDMVYAT